jgi:hypothetical protein
VIHCDLRRPHVIEKPSISTATESPDKSKRNLLAIASLVLGALSVAFAQFCSVPGVISVVGCFGVIVAIVAATTGAFGIREARKLAGQGQRLAIGGIVTAVISILIILVMLIPTMLTPGGIQAHVWATPTPTMTPTPLPLPTEPSTPLPTHTLQAHDGETFSITFSDEWEIYESGSEPTSEYLIIQHPGGALFQVYRLTFSEIPDLEAEIEAFMIGNFGAGSAIEEEIEIGGQNGRTGRFVLRTSQGQSHALFTAVANGYDIYFFLATTASEEAMVSYETEIKAIITSTEFTGPSADNPLPTPSASPLPTTPQTYQDDKFSFTYPGDWLSIDLSNSEYCNQPHVSCVLLTHSKDDIRFLIERKTHDDELDLEEFDQEAWDKYILAPHVLPKVETTVDGRPGIQRTLPESPDSSTDLYVLQIIVVNGHDGYWILAESDSSDTFSTHQSTIEEIIASIKFAE